MKRTSIITIIFILIVFVSCNSGKQAKEAAIEKAKQDSIIAAMPAQRIKDSIDAVEEQTRIQDSINSAIKKAEEEEKDITYDPKSTDCDKWVHKVNDKMSGNSYHSNNDDIIVSSDGGRTGLEISMLHDNNGLILSLKSIGTIGCIFEDDDIYILFDDDSRLELRNQSSSCKGVATLYFGGAFGKYNQLKKLKTKTITGIRVYSSNSIVNGYFSRENKIQFINIINCITK